VKLVYFNQPTGTTPRECSGPFFQTLRRRRGRSFCHAPQFLSYYLMSSLTYRISGESLPDRWLISSIPRNSLANVCCPSRLMVYSNGAYSRMVSSLSRYIVHSRVVRDRTERLPSSKGLPTRWCGSTILVKRSSYSIPAKSQ